MSTTCQCGIETNAPSGTCRVCELEDRNPGLHQSLGMMRVRISLGQEFKGVQRRREYADRYEALKSAGERAGRRSTVKTLIKKGKVKALYLKGKSNAEIAAELGLSADVVYHTIRIRKAMWDRGL